ncbi:PEP-CTERM sorting domain-containing protein [Aeoliella sp. SH292]|uniref:PEP-CTERM sorting domain-containing protein n=1 Tax=Aeoliella sp. SH292 TaxID=3454464 RepID=UPI003F9CF8DA
MKRTIAVMASALAMTLFGHVASGAIITTLNEGNDWALQRNNNVVDNRILVKNSSNNGGDRVGIMTFDSSALGPVTAASVRVDLERFATATGNIAAGATNQFLAGETLELWGVPNGHASEALTQPANNTAGSWATNPFITDADATNNNVADAALTFLGSITFGVNTNGDVLDFAGPAITSFVQADDNNVLTFLLTAVGNTADAQTPLFYNDNSSATLDPVQFYPSVMTNGDAVVPEPSTIALAGLASIALVAVGRRKA